MVIVDAKPLDIEKPGALVSYLKATGRVSEDERVRARGRRGGGRDRALLVGRHQTGGAWVVKQALPKLRVAVDWFSDPQRVHREALGLRWLEALAPPGTITPLLFEDRDNHLLAMEAVPEPHENWKTMLLDGRLENDHVEQFGRLLGTVHRGGYEHREEAEPVFRDRSVFESLRLEPYYGYAAERVPESSRVLRALVDETRSRRDTLVHGANRPHTA